MSYLSFPTLANKKFAYANKNEAAKLKHNGDFLDPEVSAQLALEISGMLAADFYYGGYLEDRSFVLKGSYLEPSKFLHLGVDVWVPEKTPVHTLDWLEIVQIYSDLPEEAGWGIRVIAKYSDNTHLVFGHIRPKVKVGDKVPPGGLIGTIEDRYANGGWAPHLHIQAIHGDISEFITYPELLDGYGELSRKDELSLRYPNPMCYIRL